MRAPRVVVFKEGSGGASNPCILDSAALEFAQLLPPLFLQQQHVATSQSLEGFPRSLRATLKLPANLAEIMLGAVPLSFEGKSVKLHKIPAKDLPGKGMRISGSGRSGPLGKAPPCLLIVSLLESFRCEIPLPQSHQHFRSLPSPAATGTQRQRLSMASACPMQPRRVTIGVGILLEDEVSSGTAVPFVETYMALLVHRLSPLLAAVRESVAELYRESGGQSRRVVPSSTKGGNNGIRGAGRHGVPGASSSHWLSTALAQDRRVVECLGEAVHVLSSYVTSFEKSCVELEGPDARRLDLGRSWYLMAMGSAEARVARQEELFVALTRLSQSRHWGLMVQAVSAVLSNHMGWVKTVVEDQAGFYDEYCPVVRQLHQLFQGPGSSKVRVLVVGSKKMQVSVKAMMVVLSYFIRFSCNLAAQEKKQAEEEEEEEEQQVGQENRGYTLVHVPRVVLPKRRIPFEDNPPDLGWCLLAGNVSQQYQSDQVLGGLCLRARSRKGGGKKGGGFFGSLFGGGAGWQGKGNGGGKRQEGGGGRTGPGGAGMVRRVTDWKEDLVNDLCLWATERLVFEQHKQLVLERNHNADHVSLSDLTAEHVQDLTHSEPTYEPRNSASCLVVQLDSGRCELVTVDACGHDIAEHPPSLNWQRFKHTQLQTPSCAQSVASVLKRSLSLIVAGVDHDSIVRFLEDELHDLAKRSHLLLQCFQSGKVANSASLLEVPPPDIPWMLKIGKMVASVTSSCK